MDVDRDPDEPAEMLCAGSSDGSTSVDCAEARDENWIDLDSEHEMQSESESDHDGSGSSDVEQ